MSSPYIVNESPKSLLVLAKLSKLANDEQLIQDFDRDPTLADFLVLVTITSTKTN